MVTIIYDTSIKICEVKRLTIGDLKSWETILQNLRGTIILRFRNIKLKFKPEHMQNKIVIVANDCSVKTGSQWKTVSDSVRKVNCQL